MKVLNKCLVVRGGTTIAGNPYRGWGQQIQSYVMLLDFMALEWPHDRMIFSDNPFWIIHWRGFMPDVLVNNMTQLTEETKLFMEIFCLFFSLRLMLVQSWIFAGAARRAGSASMLILCVSMCLCVWDNFSASDLSKIGDVARCRTT